MRYQLFQRTACPQVYMYEKKTTTSEQYAEPDHTHKKIPNKDCPTSALLLPTSVGTLSPNNRDQHSVRKLRRSLTQVLRGVSKSKLLCHSCLSCCACMYKLTRRDGVHTTHHSVSVRYLALSPSLSPAAFRVCGKYIQLSLFCARLPEEKGKRFGLYLI